MASTIRSETEKCPKCGSKVVQNYYNLAESWCSQKGCGWTSGAMRTPKPPEKTEPNRAAQAITASKPEHIRVADVRTDIGNALAEWHNETVGTPRHPAAFEAQNSIKAYLDQRERDDARLEAALLACRTIVAAKEASEKGSIWTAGELFGEAAKQARAALSDDQNVYDAAGLPAFDPADWTRQEAEYRPPDRESLDEAARLHGID